MIHNERTKLKEVSDYIDNIKRYAYKDVYNIENQVLNKNPYTSDFIKNYLFAVKKENPSILFKIKKIILFYIKNLVRFSIYLITYILFRVKCKKHTNFSKNTILIDTFLLVDNIISNGKYEERYFVGLSECLKSRNINHIILPRLYGASKNPLKIISLINILNKDENNFLFEFELLTIKDLFKIFIFILKYPFKLSKLLVKNNNELDKLYNYELINSLPTTQFIAYIRYLVGQRIAEKASSSLKIVSWQEFQDLEKTFNRAIKESNKEIKIYGCQFLVQYENYISMHITDIDYDLNITPHTVLLNGKYNYNVSEKQRYKDGVSLRYKNIFNFDMNKRDEKNIVVLLTYEVEDSIELLNLINYIENEIQIKIHPATDKKNFVSYLNEKWQFTETNIYELFYNAKIVFVASMSGTALEAVSCGVSVLLIGSNDNITANPLVEHGQGQIWDIAFSKDDVKRLYNKLLNYRKKNIEEIIEIAYWYKENFFIEPTEKNILKAFELDKE